MSTTREKRFNQLNLAINKAINSVETPVKEKHVRSTIIGTFQEQSAITYWMVAIRLPLQDNRIVAWKFCHVTHKLLREGHPACLDDSQRHIGMIENLGRLWVHLREGYGRLVHLYCNLLVTKLKFHARNPRFPGNMQLTADELDNIAENDVNNYFQLCVELFDYMDDILNLQAAVFDSLGNARANSMTASGQCRLAALIPCAQDSSHIYDCNVRLLFRLHAALPPDTLTGHRERFRQQFKKLSQFYKHASSLQYYRNLLTLPVLPSNPPNFLLQSDFGTYVTPVVSIPEPSPDEVDAIGSLIDTSDTISQATTPEQMDAFDTRTTPSPQPDPVVERDRLIDHLQNELKRMRSEASQLVQERNTMLTSMKEHCTRLESQLQEAKMDLEEEKQKAEMLSTQTPVITQKLAETEEKAKVTDEKFQKLKGAYTQLREEHIKLIRQKAEVDKVSANLCAAAAQQESAKAALQQQLNDRMKDVELLQQSASTSEEVEAYKNELASIRTELEHSRQKEAELETLKASMESLEIEHKTATAEQQERLTTVTNELKETTEALEKLKHENDEKENELNRVKVELVGLREKSGEEYKKAIEEKESALKKIEELTQLHRQEKEVQEHRFNDLQAKYDLLQIKLVDAEISQQTQLKVNEENIAEKETKISSLEDKLNEFILLKSVNECAVKELELERDKMKSQIDALVHEKVSIQKTLTERDSEISKLGNCIKELQDEIREGKSDLYQMKDDGEKAISILQELVENKDDKIKELEISLQDKLNIIDSQKAEVENLMKAVTECESSINNKNTEIESCQTKLSEISAQLERQTEKFEELRKDKDHLEALLNDKLKTVIDSKDEIIEKLQGILTAKGEELVMLNVEVNKLTLSKSKLEEKLKETNAELEIGKNELLNMRQEHERIVEDNENNLTLKNKELRNLQDEISRLKKENTDIFSEKEKVIIEFNLEKQVLENKLKEAEDLCKEQSCDYEALKTEKIETTEKLMSEKEGVKQEYEHFKESKEDEIKTLLATVQNKEEKFHDILREKDKKAIETQKELEELKSQLIILNEEYVKDKEHLSKVLSNKDQEIQFLESRLQHAEGSRLNAECELQDLLQHNSVLEADLAAAKRQAEEAKREIEKQSSRLVTTAGEAAVKVTEDALAALEQASAQESSQAAADIAATALADLVKLTELKGNEDSVAQAAIYAAHNTARLSAYVTEVCNTSTDIEKSEKLSNECRTMLTATKQCLESLRSGSLPGASCTEVTRHVKSVAQAAAAADRLNSGARSVDDELADMDSAIEQAASQIEEMLKASRAGDTGVKLEVNGKILDACTTLMGAVKILVQDARRLQNELGDPKTRLKMYRRNPQWSEGLISAAKAVVFAAKLLVSSADEAVGAAGRVEGVSAAAHEVAGSTAQLVAASRARAPPSSPALARLTQASRSVAAATGAVVAAVRAGSQLVNETEALDTSALTLTATRRLEMESKVRALELETALEAERARLAALRKRHYQLEQLEENGNMTNGRN